MLFMGGCKNYMRYGEKVICSDSGRLRTPYIFNLVKFEDRVDFDAYCIKLFDAMFSRDQCRIKYNDLMDI